jgi:energy-coupling factor transporter ATP-binding protein EcfA2
MRRVIDYVLGAPGSGKSTLVPHLRQLLPGRVVLDWDAFMDPAGELAGVPIRTTPDRWQGYADLVGSVVEAVGSVDLVLLSVCTPAELADWANGSWALLDCADDERRRRLGERDPGEVTAALSDAAAYRELGLATVDTTGLDPAAAAAALVILLRRPGAP